VCRPTPSEMIEPHIMFNRTYSLATTFVFWSSDYTYVITRAVTGNPLVRILGVVDFISNEATAHISLSSRSGLEPSCSLKTKHGYWFSLVFRI
jgi:hypothetical protein